MAFIQYMARIQFDFGARHTLPDELALCGVSRPLVVSDAGVAASGVLDLALEALPLVQSQHRFTDVHSNPRLSSVLAALDLYRNEGCDGVIAVGGGSVIDCAKGVALLATHEPPIHTYLAARGGGARITSAIAPLIAMPTTAGTGSEIGRGMGIVLPDAEGVFISLNLIPRTAICDPELTLGLPKRLTAGAGADALSHCIEAYLSPATNPPADAVALDAAKRIFNHLPRAVTDGGDRDARWNVMMGALEAAMSMWKGLGAAHALSIPFEAANCHHGTLVGVLLPHAVRFATPAVAPGRMEALAGALGARADDLPEVLSAFNRAIELPANLKALGIAESMIESGAEHAARSIFNQTAPRRGDTADYAALARKAFA